MYNGSVADGCFLQYTINYDQVLDLKWLKLKKKL